MFAQLPTGEQLATFQPAPRARRLRLDHRDEFIELTLGSATIWFLLPGLIWFGGLIVIAPFTAPIWGGEFMGWWRWWGLVAFTWIVLLPSLLLLLTWLSSAKSSGEVALVIDPQTPALHLPAYKRSLGAEEIDSIVEVLGMQTEGAGVEPVIQTSVVSQLPSGQYELLPIVTQIRPPPDDLRLADLLADYLLRPVIRVEVDERDKNSVG